MARSKSRSRTLTDHNEIRNWAEERGARPSCVRGTGIEGDIGMLRLDFPGYSGENSLEEIGWDDWFNKFDERNLALLVQDEMASGQESNFNKLISRETAEEADSGRRARGGARARTTSRARTGSRAKRGRSSSRRQRRSAGASRGKRSASRNSSSRRTSARSQSRRGKSSRSTSRSSSRGTRSRAVSKKSAGRVSSSRSNNRRKAA